MTKPRSGLLGRLSKLFSARGHANGEAMHLSLPVRRPFSFEVEYQPKDRCVKITTHGTYTKEADEQMLSAGIKAVREYHTNLVLIDERDQENGLKYTEVFDLAEDHERMHVPHDVRVAILFKPTKENLSKYRLYENRSVICGFKHHVFTDERSARDWLFAPRPRMRM